MTDTTETTHAPAPQPQVQLAPNAVAVHYQGSATFWERQALALQHTLYVVTSERDALRDEVERLRNPPVVVKAPPSATETK